MPIPTEIRLKSADTEAHERFNYTGLHRYILTLPARGSAPAFTTREQTTPVLDALRESSWRHHFDVYAYCFLPDRLLLIVRGKEETSHLKTFLRDFRAAAEGAVAPSLGHQLWSRTYLERVLRKTEISSDAAKGIFAMPVTLGLARTPSEYLLQGSFVKDVGVLYGGGVRTREGAGTGAPARTGGGKFSRMKNAGRTFAGKKGEGSRFGKGRGGGNRPPGKGSHPPGKGSRPPGKGSRPPGKGSRPPGGGNRRQP